MLPLAGVLVGVVLLSGCVPGDPVVTPQPEPSSTPLFASEEEALAAATEAYAAYLAMSDTITSEGGARPERIKPFVSEEQYERELIGFEAYGDQGNHSEGSSQVDSPKLQAYDAATSRVSIYICLDLSGTRVVGPTGETVSPPEASGRLPIEASFVNGSEATIVVDGSEPWSGSDFCAL